MKFVILQPPYGYDAAKADEYFDWKLQRLAECTPEADAIVLPEYSDVPYAAPTGEETLQAHER